MTRSFKRKAKEQNGLFYQQIQINAQSCQLLMRGDFGIDASDLSFT
jgi:hypothetical protein